MPIDGDGGNNNLSGTAGADTINGFAGNDFLYGLGGDDQLNGGNDDDELHGGPGNDTLDAGAGGSDVASYTSAAAGVTVNLGSGKATNDGDGGSDTIVGVEYVYGSAFADSITGDGANNAFLGNAGNDTFTGGGGRDQVTYNALGAGNVNVNLGAGTASNDGFGGIDTLINIQDIGGGQGNDTIVGSSIVNLVYGYLGNDSVDGGGGDDVVHGDDGDDTLIGGAGNDQIDGGANTDTASYAGAAAGASISLTAGTGTDGDGGTDTLSNVENLLGSGFNDTLTGDNSINVLTGGNGNDRLVGLDADDTLSGGAGNDTLIGGANNDLLDGGADIDTIDYSQHNAAINASLKLNKVSDLNLHEDGVVNVEIVIGTGFNDTIVGSTVGDKLVGDGGQDDIDGEDGNDTLVGGVGDDTIDGNTGIDRADYSVSSGAVNVNLFLGTASDGMGGTDTLSNFEEVAGSDFNDTVVGDVGNNAVFGGKGNDELLGLKYGDVTPSGDDSLYGQEGDDKLYGSTGSDLLDGGDGIDTAYYDDSTTNRVTVDLVAGTASVNLTSDVDTLVGIENVTTWDYDDKVTGNSNANLIITGDGNDTLIGNQGNDTLNGGAPGTGGGGAGDWVVYSGDPAAVVVDLSAGKATDGWGGSDVLIGIELVTGSAFDDQIHGDGVDNSIDGGNGNDTLSGGAGIDTLIGGLGTDTATYQNASAAIVVDMSLSNEVANDGDGGDDNLTAIERVVGSAFNDTITGAGNDESFDGGGGNDSIRGGGGNDNIDGSPGNDTLDGEGGTDYLHFEAASGGVALDLSISKVTNDGMGGQDTINGFEVIYGSAFADQFVGDGNANAFVTYDGADELDGGGGADILSGGDGDDTLIGGAGADDLNGGPGEDIAQYTSSGSGITIDLGAGTGLDGTGSTDTLVDVESVVGSFFGDKITGSNVHNHLTGGNGNDTLYGMDGDDELIGGLGNDALDGGLGTADVADYTSASSGLFVDLGSLSVSDGDGGTDSIIAVEIVWGSDFADVMVGDGAGNHLFGYGGNDTLNGAGGNDTLVGGSGTNKLDGGIGLDWAYYGNLEAFLSIDLTAGTTTGSGFSDQLLNIENAHGGFLADSITGTTGDNALLGSTGDDTLIGGGGADTLEGGDDVDTAEFALDISAYTIINIGVGSYTVKQNVGGQISILTGVENLLFNGKAFNDGVAPVFVGGVPGEGTVGVAPEADIELQFDESVQLGAGSIVIKDGLGAVVASYTKASSELTVSANKLTINPAANLAYGTTYVVEFGLDSVQDFGGNKFAGAALTFKTLEGTAIEIVDKKTGNLPDQETIFGSPGSDTVVLAGAQSGVIVDLGKGQASGPGGTVTLISIEGAVGSGFDDQLIGNDGDNFFDGQDGNDTIEGGPGSDTASYEDAPGGVNVDLTKGSATGDGDDTLISIENVDGSGNNDTITGSNVDNILDGGPGADQMKGGLGNDTYYVDNAGDQPIEENNNTLGAVLRFAQQIQDLREALLNDDRRLPVVDIGANVDKVIASIDHTLGAFIENLDLAGGGDTKGTGNELANAVNGNGGNNGLNGGGGNDTIDGGSGNDSINGGSGNDVLVGGEGNDTLSGGGGNDSVIYGRSQSSYTVTQNPDGSFTVKDNTGADGTDTILAGATLLFGGVPFAPPATEAPAPPAPPPGTTSQPNTVTGADPSGFIGSGINLTGGSGYDVVVFNTAKGPITIDLTRKSFSGGGGGGRIEGVEGIIGSLFGDTMLGDDGPNLFDGGFGADIFFGGAGDDTLAGGDGLDLAIYLGSSSKYTVTADGKGGLTISGGADGRDTLTGVERISFGDKSLAFDLSPEGSAGKTALLAGALLGKGSLANAPLMGTLVSYFDGGKSLGDASTLLVSSGLIGQLAGGSSNEALVGFLFTNLIGAPPDAATTAQLAGLITSGQFTQASFLTAALQLDLTQSVVGLTGLASTGLAFG